MAMADKFVILDNVPFRKNYFQNRNKARTAGGWTWFTVPVSRGLETVIKDVAVAGDSRWKRKWRDTIYYSYKKAPFFESYFSEIEAALEQDMQLLSDLNTALLLLLSRFLHIEPHFVKASTLDASGRGSDLILAICKELGADLYLSGISGKDYLKLEEFRDSGIAIEFQDFHHPIYKQLHEPFMPCMSVIDLLFNYGDRSREIINGIGVPVMEEVFL